ncbi:hypothetical protein LTR78_008451 [Recurvomyces mirabilis]|uniref:Chromo domain-containing protein n=1 Tax=Recurvomyces mirabilis TaxID=574656 RepID=A0AAE0TT96_9PEZI|nr:hypothetical protein LTR78_008451 [Recurvomyces mirabilis]KAK5155439.1 hypothetical protein LTS14_005700 [Recurvomyces mirabilis]
MTSRARGPFEESDVDSVASNTTEGSDELEIYNVDRVLAEKVDDEDGKLKYLLKWTGYGDHRSTWEPRENVQSGNILIDWKQRKLKIQQGEEQPFDLEAWEDECQSLYDQSLERRRRRKQKRRRRGMTVSSTEDEYDAEERTEDDGVRKRDSRIDSDDVEVIAGVGQQWGKRIKASPIKRKGTAQKLATRRRASTSSSSEAEEDNTQADSDFNSLFDAGSQPIYPDLDTLPRKVSTVQKAPKPAPSKVPASRTNTSAPLSNKTQLARRLVPVNSAMATAKRSKGVFANFNKVGPAKTRQQRAPMDGASTSDPKAPHLFKKLGHRSRYQRHDRERAPDFNALTIIDPRTGRPEPPTAVSSVPDTASTNNTNPYARGESRPERSRSATPPRVGASQISSVFPSTHRRFRTCVHWLENRCRSKAEDCSYAHYYITEESKAAQAPSNDVDMGPPPPPPLPAMPPAPTQQWEFQGKWTSKFETSCYYWLKEGCTKPDSVCEFAHRITGVLPNAARRDANLPGQLKEWKTKICPDWRQGRCLLLESHCKFAHRETESQQEPSEQLIRSYPLGMKTMTCHFWLHGGCVKSEAACEFAHHDTGQYKDPRVLPVRESEHASFAPPPPPPPPPLRDTNREQELLRTLPRSEITCYFWSIGTCRRADHQCSYAHWDTGVVALPPPGFVKRDSMPGPPTRTQSFNDATMDHGSTSILPDLIARMEPAQSDTTTYRGVLQVSTSGYIRHNIDADISVSGRAQFEQLFYPVAKGIHFMPDCMVTQSDVQAWLSDLVAQGMSWPAGTIQPVEGSRQVADKLAEVGRLHAAAFASLQDSFTLLVYPADSDLWRFIEPSNAPPSASAPLRFRLLPPLTGVEMPPNKSQNFQLPIIPDTVKDRASVAATMYVLGFDPEIVLLPEKDKENRIFLAWPESRAEEMQFLIRLFQDLKCKVYHSGAAGSWDYVRKNHRSFALIVHPDTPFWALPGLYALLQSGSAFRVFCVGPQLDFDAGDMVPKYTLKRLFPNGKATLLTDSLFTDRPERATELIRQFLVESNNKPEGGRNDKIVTRPGVKQWLFELLEHHTRPDDTVDACWIDLYSAVNELCPPEDEDLEEPSTPLPESYLVSIPARQMPTFMGLTNTDSEAAADLLVQWFAGWAVENAPNFRRFVVCHESQKTEVVVDGNGRSSVQVVVDPEGWANKYRHVGVLRLEDILPKKGRK